MRRIPHVRRHLSKRDIALQRRAMDEHYAALAGVEPVFANDIEIPKARKTRMAKAGPSEHQIQAAVIQWWTRAHRQFDLPEFALAAVPNGGARDAITGSRLKSEGVRAGFLDLILSVVRDPYHGLFIEMKTADGRVTPAQKEWLEYLDKAGYKTAVCRSVDSAIAAITAYLNNGPLPGEKPKQEFALI